jgi:pilus assembly protein Flp/PilA
LTCRSAGRASGHTRLPEGIETRPGIEARAVRRAERPQVRRRWHGCMAVGGFGPPQLRKKMKGKFMNALVSRAKAFLVNEDGPTATEYAVMLALIIVVAIAAVTLLGQSVQGVFSNVNTKIQALPS